MTRSILKTGEDRQDRTGTGTKSIFGSRLKFSLSNNTLPLLTTKKMFLKGIVEELLFFIRGETDTKILEAKGVNIWKGNTTREFLDSRGLCDYPEGEMGPMYGSKWRNFHGIDQLANALHLIKTEPSSRRIIVSAYDPSASDKCVLDPCHLFFQFSVNNEYLSCQFYMRSCDVGLGLPFNVASYALLTHLMAKASGLKAKEIIFVGGDTHIYSNHIEPIKEQLQRTPFIFPKINIKKDLKSIKEIEQLQFEDFELIDYQHHSTIKMSMAV